jgi:hypothetical protein
VWWFGRVRMVGFVGEEGAEQWVCSVLSIIGEWVRRQTVGWGGIKVAKVWGERRILWVDTGDRGWGGDDARDDGWGGVCGLQIQSSS